MTTVQGRGQGVDKKATEARKLEAQIFIKVCQLRGKKEIVRAVKEKYANFGKANGKGFEHNSDGLRLGLQLLADADFDMANQLRLALGMKALPALKLLMTINEARKALLAAGIPGAKIKVAGTNQFKVTLKVAYRGQISLVKDAQFKTLRTHEGHDTYIVTFNARPFQPETAPTPQNEPQGGEGQEPEKTPEIAPEAATVPESADQTQPVKTFKTIQRRTAKAVKVKLPDKAPAQSGGDKESFAVRWVDLGLKTFAVRKCGQWFSGRDSQGSLITFHEGQAAFIGDWIGGDYAPA